MKKKISVIISIIAAIVLLLPISHALTCEFSGWDIPKLSSDNTITLDGEKWVTIDSKNNKEYTRRIEKESSQGSIPHLASGLTEQDYLDNANDFLERNDDDLKIETFSELTLRDDIEVPKTVDFLGESQYCYNIPVIGTFAGAIEFSDDEIYSITSKWFAPVVIDSVEPQLNPEDIGIGDDSKLKILPTGNDFKLVYEADQGDEKKYFDANTGQEIENPAANNFAPQKTNVRLNLDAQSIFLIAMLAIIVIFITVYLVYLRKQK